MAATNPGGIGHAWVKMDTERSKQSRPRTRQVFFIPSTVYDNKFTQQGYIDQLKALPEQNIKTFRRIMGYLQVKHLVSEVNTHVVKPFAIQRMEAVYINGLGIKQALFGMVG